jgi:hypothetical protein
MNKPQRIILIIGAALFLVLFPRAFKTVAEKGTVSGVFGLALIYSGAIICLYFACRQRKPKP